MSCAPLALLLSLLGPVYVAGLLVSLVNYALATIQRCHDPGLRGWWALVLGMPSLPTLLVIPGKPGVVSRANLTKQSTYPQSGEISGGTGNWREPSASSRAASKGYNALGTASGCTLQPSPTL